MNIASWIFCACVLYTIWVLAGYPIWLWWRATRQSRRPVRGPYQPSVTAVIPVYNGSRYLAAKLDSVLASEYPPGKLDVLVLSDASTDATDAIGEEYAAKGRVRFVRLPRGGKAAALTEAFRRTEAEVLLMTDVRQRLDPGCVSRLMEEFHDPSVGVVSGNLLILRGDNSQEANVGLYWRYESWIRSNLGRIDSLLGATGPIYAIRRHLVRPLPPQCLLDDVWLPMQAVLAGFRSTWAEDAKAWDYPTALQTEFARKVRTQAGIYQLLWQEPRLFTGANRMRWAFLNLKLGRLFLPHVLLLQLVVSFWLPPGLRALAVSAQAVGYGLVLADLFVSETSPWKRLTSPIRAFVTLLAAAFFAQKIFFVKPGQLWKVTYAQPNATGPSK